MMSYDKYKRGRQQFTGDQQIITYIMKAPQFNYEYLPNLILTLKLTQNDQWVRVDQVTQIHWLSSPPNDY